MVSGSQRSAEDDMPIQDAADSIADWLIEVIPFHQDGEEASDGAGLAAPRAFEEPRQHRKH